MWSSMRKRRLPVCFACFSLSACAYMPKSVADLPWVDLWGERGAQVLVRDYAMCESLVEQRRGLLSGCMLERGWSVD